MRACVAPIEASVALPGVTATEAVVCVTARLACPVTPPHVTVTTAVPLPTATTLVDVPLAGLTVTTIELLLAHAQTTPEIPCPSESYGSAEKVWVAASDVRVQLPGLTDTDTIT